MDRLEQLQKAKGHVKLAADILYEVYEKDWDNLPVSVERSDRVKIRKLMTTLLEIWETF